MATRQIDNEWMFYNGRHVKSEQKDALICAAALSCNIRNERVTRCYIARSFCRDKRLRIFFFRSFSRIEKLFVFIVGRYSSLHVNSFYLYIGFSTAFLYDTLKQHVQANTKRARPPKINGWLTFTISSFNFLLLTWSFGSIVNYKVCSELILSNADHLYETVAD